MALLWAAVAAFALVFAPLAASLVPALPACPLKGISGIPCPACGSGRATMALAEGRLFEALWWNPGATAFGLAFVLGGVGVGLAAARGAEPPSVPRELPVWLRWVALGGLAANWLWVWLVAGV